jgi:hypothetical protein
MRSQPTGNLIDFKSTFPLRRDGGIVFENVCCNPAGKYPNDGPH